MDPYQSILNNPQRNKNIWRFTWNWGYLCLSPGLSIRLGFCYLRVLVELHQSVELWFQFWDHFDLSALYYKSKTEGNIPPPTFILRWGWSKRGCMTSSSSILYSLTDVLFAKLYGRYHCCTENKAKKTRFSLRPSE